MKKQTFLKSFICVLLMTLLTMLSVFDGLTLVSKADEELPYDTYIYDYWGDIVYTPAAYVPDRAIGGQDLKYNDEKIGAFNAPQDLCKAENGDIFVADTGNNRIVVIDSTLTKVIRIYDSFDNEGAIDTFNAPTGVCVSSKNLLYVADSINRRVVILDVETGELIGFVQNPESDVLEAGFVFTPLKVSVDYADRVYCIAQNMFEGIMVFESNGEFTGFYGTIEVKISLWEKFWRKLATKEERSKSQLFIPTEFTGIDVDEEGFVYATNIDSEGVQGVRRLNPRGEDVIKTGENANVGGDLQIHGTTDFSGPSQITDVVYRTKGIYSLLDKKRGRIFTYDHEGNLLYIFGGLGTQEGTFSMPVAIETIGGIGSKKEQIVVLDSLRSSIMCFTATEYGKLINEAVGLRYDGDEKLAVEKWQEVLKLNENFELANSGIGKAYLTAGDNLSAMHYLKIAMNREYYSIAFKRYRNEILKANLQYFLTGGAVLIAAFVIWKKVKKKDDKDSSNKKKEDLLNG